MNDSIIYSYAVQICCSDHISGFIPVKPITNIREHITEQRLSCLFKLVGAVHDEICTSYSDKCADEVYFAFEKALQLTCSDISCGVIAVEPILYDRDEKIVDTIKLYSSMVMSQIDNNDIVVGSNISNCLSENLNQTGCDKGDVLLLSSVNKVRNKRKIKKGKR